MIGYLQGNVLEHTDGKMIVGVGDSNSFGVIGYSVSVPQNGAYDRHGVGEKIELFIYSHVREDAFDLYGFSSKFEKALFLTLLTVNGIGPRSALGILSSVDPSQLVDAIIQGDQGFLTQVPGIGKKTAERVVVELRDSMRKKVQSGAFTFEGKGQAVSSRSSHSVGRRSSDGNDSMMFQDAKDALIGLGYREQDIHQLLTKVMENGETPPQRAEELVRTALRQLG